MPLKNWLGGVWLLGSHPLFYRRHFHRLYSARVFEVARLLHSPASSRCKQPASLYGNHRSGWLYAIPSGCKLHGQDGIENCRKARPWKHIIVYRSLFPRFCSHEYGRKRCQWPADEESVSLEEREDGRHLHAKNGKTEEWRKEENNS